MAHVPITEAAMRLKLTYNQVRNRLFRGDLAGGRDAYGKLFVVLEDKVEPDAEGDRPNDRSAAPELKRKEE